MSGSTRERVIRSGIAAAVTVLLTSSIAGAHGGAADSIHACVVPSSGTIRIVDDAESCNKNERALDWSKENTSSAIYTAGSGLALSPTNEFSVTGAPWSGLTGVPTGFADGNDDNGAGQVSALRAELSAGGVTGGVDGWIRDGSITAADLAGTYAFGGTESVIGAVTSEKIADGTIDSRDIASGAITTSRQTSNASVVTGTVARLTEGVPRSVVSSILTLPSGASHNVLLLGQATLDCTACGTPVEVTYWLSEGGMTVSPVLTATVDSANGDIVLPIFSIDQASAGGGTFDLVVSATGLGSGIAAVESPSLSAIDLGRAP